MKNVFNSIISRLKKTKERISELEDRSIEITQTAIQKEKE